jgi:hypothetical protein
MKTRKGAYMKKLLILTLLTATYSVPSHALVVLVINCETQDGDYRVSILNNQGIGPVRNNHLSATIYDKNETNIASYIVSPPPLIQSTSFGRSPYLDLKTNGQKFSLAFPSTNYKHTSLLAVLADGTTISDENMVCNKL